MNFEIFTLCKKTSPANEAQIAALESSRQVLLPDSYKEFLRFSNGLTGEAGGKYVDFWKADDLLQSNTDYAVNEFAPGLLMIGSNGGEEAIGIDLRPDSKTKGQFYEIPFIPMDWKEARLLGSTIEEVVSNLE